jgi:hypothetical protein
MGSTKSIEEKKLIIQSMFFEYLKMRYVLENGFGLHLGRNVYVPLQQISDYVNSLLMVDLFSVWEVVVNYMFESKKIPKPEKSKDKMNVLKDNGLLLQAEYIKWYVDWRNDIAHRSEKAELHILNQAFNDVKKQLVCWDIISDYQVGKYIIEAPERIYRMGVSLDGIIIIEYKIEFQDQPCGLTTSYGESVNLSFDEYLKKSGKNIKSCRN